MSRRGRVGDCLFASIFDEHEWGNEGHFVMARHLYIFMHDWEQVSNYSRPDQCNGIFRQRFEVAHRES
jgi:hypothetical protein